MTRIIKVKKRKHSGKTLSSRGFDRLTGKHAMKKLKHSYKMYVFIHEKKAFPNSEIFSDYLLCATHRLRT